MQSNGNIDHEFLSPLKGENMGWLARCMEKGYTHHIGQQVSTHCGCNMLCLTVPVTSYAVAPIKSDDCETRVCSRCRLLSKSSRPISSRKKLNVVNKRPGLRLMNLVVRAHMWAEREETICATTAR